ncbi:MAG TPA: MFS transporter [Stellaceae bacterium]|nr:MFS transporter [Stellaceae bacterium]
MASSASTASARTSARLPRVIVAASIGNALEWFDILVYGYFAVTISGQFFPKTDPAVALLLTFGTFGASYLIRPLGAIALGAYADRAGRKASLMVSILLMMIGTFIMAVIPPYAVIGLLAPIGMFVARLMQGFSVGGEFGSSTAFLVEHGPQRKGFLASWQWSSQGVAALLASLFGFVLAEMLSPEQLQSWGWRMPYLFGLLIGPVGFYIRGYVDETPEFLRTETTRTPVRDVLARQWDRLLLAIGLVAISTGSNYLLLYMPTYAVTELHLPQATGFLATVVGAVVLIAVAPLAGHWSDRVGRTRIMQAMTWLFLLSVYPAFVLLTDRAVLAVLVLVVGWLGLIKAGYSGVLPSLLSELFPTRTRGTGMALSYNISVPVFGGFAPVIIQSLIDVSGNKLAPAFYLMVTAALSLLSLALLRRHLRLR